jgi:hypothetical protein
LAEDYILSKAQSQEVANAFFESVSNNSKAAKVENNRISSTKSIPDNGNKDALFVNIYEGGGFVVVSADKRIQPILAFSQNNDFPLLEVDIPCGLDLWIDDYVSTIDSLRKNKSPQREEIKKIWADYTNANKAAKDSTARTTNYNQCPYYAYEGMVTTDITTKNPLLTTTWGQGVGYNNYCPHENCSNTTNGRSLAGCVAVATGMVMRYHEHPTYVNWSVMPDNTGSNTTSSLLFDIGARVDMDWGCSSSGATTSKAVDALTDDYGYSSASYVDFAYQTVKNELSGNHPVILRGRNSNGSGGHAWVTDGYKQTDYYECQQDPYGSGLVSVLTHSTLYFNMVWGWGTYGIGYYAFNNWNSPVNTYNDNKKMITNIRP